MTFYRFFHILLNFSGKTMGARVTMRIWTTGLVAICLAIGGAGPRAAAQVALPSAQLPEAGRVLSTLPDTGVLEPLVETSERLTQLRLDRIGALVRSHRDSIELDDRGEPARHGDEGAGLEYLRRVGVEGEPPPEEGRRRIDRPVAEHEPGRPKLGLIGERRGGPLRRGPHGCEHDQEDREDLTPEDFGCRHGIEVDACRTPNQVTVIMGESLA